MRLSFHCNQPSRLLTAILVASLFWVAPPITAARGDRTDSQLEFGIKMAKRGLWNEALFRFSRVLKERPGDLRVLNNMAVAYEAIGEFDKALEYYQKALQGDSSNRELRRNYAQFVEFYESLRPQTEEEPEAEEPEAEEANTDSGESESDSNGGFR